MSAALRLEDQALTHTGLARSANEDSMLSLPDQRVWLVADGMGGHQNGSFASQAIVASARNADFPESLEGACEAVGDAIHSANGEIFAVAQEERKVMGSTVVALVMRDDEFAVLWAGDSRAYLFRDDTLILLTRDHSQVQDMMDRGLLREEDIADHPMRHILSRAVGVQEALEIDAIRDRSRPGDVFLLCSDGLHGVISDAEIEDTVRRLGSSAGDRLVEQCLDQGAPDNVTVTLVAVSEPTLLSVGGGEATA